MKQRPLFDWSPDAVRQKNGIGSHPRLVLRDRVCPTCGKEFQPRFGQQTYCTSRCRRASSYDRDYALRHRERLTRQAREWSQKNPSRVLNAHLKRNYGITLDEFNRMLTEQGGGCAICGAREGKGKGNGVRLHVDHDHVTGKARGLLCGTCNRGIGQLGDDLERVLAAVRYLQRGREPKKESESA
jgi:hypothetical protein